MKPVDFKGSNIVFAKDQPEYLPLPAFRDASGQVVTCWQLNRKERRRIRRTGKLWLCVLTFNQPLQPQLPSIDSPFAMEKK